MTAPSPEQAAAYDAGRAAFTGGKKSTVCPYPAGSDERVLFARGYQQARRDARLAEVAGRR